MFLQSIRYIKLHQVYVYNLVAIKTIADNLHVNYFYQAKHL